MRRVAIRCVHVGERRRVLKSSGQGGQHEKGVHAIDTRLCVERSFIFASSSFPCLRSFGVGPGIFPTRLIIPVDTRKVVYRPFVFEWGFRFPVGIKVG
jgi:hypothetical protein